jgi:hypothetical protein
LGGCVVGERFGCGLKSAAPDLGGDVGAGGGLLAQGVDEGIEVDGVDSARSAVHGIFHYLDYFADVEDYVSGELGGGEEFENGCC